MGERARKLTMGEGADSAEGFNPVMDGSRETEGASKEDLTAVYTRNKRMRVGRICTCPVCYNRFVKRTGSQAFCGVRKKGKSSCRDKYHNLTNPERMLRARLYEDRA